MAHILIPKDTFDHSEDERVLIPAGRHLVRITGAQEMDAGEYVLVKYVTLAPRPGLNGEERFYLSEKAVKRFAALCKRAGLVSRGDDPASMAIDPFDLEGLILVVDVHHEKATSKKGEEYPVSRWDFLGFWRRDDERVADFVGQFARTPRPAPPTSPTANGDAF